MVCSSSKDNSLEFSSFLSERSESALAVIRTLRFSSNPKISIQLFQGKQNILLQKLFQLIPIK